MAAAAFTTCLRCDMAIHLEAGEKGTFEVVKMQTFRWWQQQFGYGRVRWKDEGEKDGCDAPPPPTVKVPASGRRQPFVSDE